MGRKKTVAGLVAEKAGSAAGAAAEKTRTEPRETHLEYSLRDAEKVQGGAVKHEAALAGVGVLASEIKLHGAVTDRVAVALNTHDEQSVDARTEAGARDAELQGAIDKLASVKRRAHLAFSAGRKRADVDRKALRSFGVGIELPRTVPAFKRPLLRIAEAMKNPDWKKAMARRGVGAAEIKDLNDAVTAASKAAARHGSTRSGKALTHGALVGDVAEMRRLTTYLRNAANAAFHGSAERSDFDPPPRGRPRKKAPESTPPAA